MAARQSRTKRRSRPAPPPGQRTLTLLQPIATESPLPVAQISDGVRHAVAADAEALAWIYAQSWQVALEHGIVPNLLAMQPYETNVRRFRSRLENSALPILVAVRESKVVGYAALSWGTWRQEAVIDSLHVLPEHWTGRVVANLFTSIASYLTRNTATHVSITVRADNAETQFELAHHGFVMKESCLRRGIIHTRHALSFAATQQR